MPLLANTRKKYAAGEATSAPQQGFWALWVVAMQGKVQEAGA